MLKKIFSNKRILLFIAMFVSQPLMAGLSSSFVFSVDTQLGLGTNTFTIPTTGADYNYNVDCDDVNPLTNTAQAQTGDYTCIYASPGIYTIRIDDNQGDGTGFPRVYFNNGGDKDKILDVIQWGKGQWMNMAGAFRGASNMTVTATDVPDFFQVSSMAEMFRSATVANPVTSGWNTTNVTDMRLMFALTDMANPDTSGWNTANVTNMSNMFWDADMANPDTSGWNTANVTDMRLMFASANEANPDTSGWNTANVINMSSMFQNAGAANPDTSDWVTAKVTTMRAMFDGAISSNPDTSNWDITDVTSMQNMFRFVTLPTVSYDAMLVHFNSQAVQSGVDFNGGNSIYCASEVEHDNLINTHGWIITDGGLNPMCSDIIFKNSFEIEVVTFNANDKQFTFDFGLLDTVKLDSYPKLIAIGVDDDKEKVIKIHVRISGEYLQIRISDIDRNEYGENQWIHQEWQNITNDKLTTVSW